MRSCVQKWDSGSVQVDCSELEVNVDVNFGADLRLEEAITNIESAIERKKVVIRNCLFVTVQFTDNCNKSVKRSYTAYNGPGNDLTELDKHFMAVFVITDIMMIYQGSINKKGAENLLQLREELFRKLRKGI